MKVSALLTDVKARVDTNAEEVDMLTWVNTLEQSIYRNLVKEATITYIDIVASQSAYDISAEAFKFEDIEELLIDEIPYTKRGGFSDDKNYYTYYKSGDNLVLYPTPLTAETDGIEVRFIRKPTLKTSANKTTLDLDIVADYGEEFLNLYKYYCYREACIYNREYQDANLWGTMYNDSEASFYKWIANRKPQDMANYRKRYWR